MINPVGSWIALKLVGGFCLDACSTSCNRVFPFQGAYPYIPHNLVETRAGLQDVEIRYLGK